MMLRISPLKRVAALAIGLCLHVGVAYAQTPPSGASTTAVRKAFTDAYEAARAGDDTQPVTDSAALHAYPLYPYLQAARIERSLADAGAQWDTVDERAGRFLRAHAAEPVALPLRQAWLASLADRGLWQAFLDAFRPQAATPALRCLKLTARIKTGSTDGLAAAIVEQWLTPARTPPECEPAFDWLRARGALTDDLIERRVRLLLGDGRAKLAESVAKDLPEVRAAPLLWSASMLLDPQTQIDALIAAPPCRIDPKVLVAGWTKLATNDPDAALARFGALVRACDPSAQEISLLAQATAFGLAWDRRPEALDFFARIQPADVDDYTLEWQARAAMWAGNWPLVAGSIARMSVERREHSAWRYWAGRAAEEMKDPADAHRLYQSLLPDDNYYSAMAAARLHRYVTPHQRQLPRNAAQLREIASRGPFIRARELLAVGMRTDAMREWQYGLDGLPAEARRQSVHLAADWGWYDTEVSTATDQGIFYAYRLLYPEPYPKEVAAASALTKLDEPLIYALLRQESLFYAKTASPAGALGLTQLLPATARRVAHVWHQRRPTRGDLLDPAVNIRLGAAALRSLIDAFDGEIGPGLAAYNAGRSNVEHWLPDRRVDADVWIENIPYNETRAYVRHVLWHSLVFKWIDTGRPQNARSWLSTVEPPQDSAGLKSADSPSSRRKSTG